MGHHAFTDTPSQAARLETVYPEIVNEGMVGVAQGWDISVALWRAAAGFDAYYPGNAHHTLSFSLGGAGIQRLDGRFAGQVGHADSDMFMLYAGGGSRRYGARGDVRICQLYFHSTMVQAIDEAGAPGGGVLELRDDRIFARDLELRKMADQYLSRALDSASPPLLLEMDARAVLLGVHLVRHHSNRTPCVKEAKGKLNPRHLATVFDYVETHLDRDLPLAELAEIAGLSPHHFCTAFRRSTGTSPHRYVICRRIERAKRLLRGQASLAEISLCCGFGSQQHFTTAFRQAEGTTPGVARALLRSA